MPLNSDTRGKRPRADADAIQQVLEWEGATRQGVAGREMGVDGECLRMTELRAAGGQRLMRRMKQVQQEYSKPAKKISKPKSPV
jgi:hypothetical protein